MSAGGAVPYRLRPNKAVDRELFLSLLTRLAATLKLEEYRYVGLGGPFMEDFRLIHARLGIEDLVCVEAEEDVHKRQLFNRPIQGVECVHETLEEYLESHDHDRRCIIWLDYTDPRDISDQIGRFALSVGEVALGSILRITLNANPSSLGTPRPEEITAKIGDLPPGDPGKPTMQEWRLQRFRERLGALFPNGLTAEGMTFKEFGKSVLRALQIAVEKELLSHPEREVVWALATHYADGQAMATATLVVCGANEGVLTPIVQDWEFFSTPDAPHVLDMPSLSTMERLSMESSEDPRAALGFDLPVSDMGQDPFEAFDRFYRIYPHFSRVEP